jgi:hypothetical protein
MIPWFQAEEILHFIADRDFSLIRAKAGKSGFISSNLYTLRTANLPAPA